MAVIQKKTFPYGGHWAAKDLWQTEVEFIIGKRGDKITVTAMDQSDGERVAFSQTEMTRALLMIGATALLFSCTAGTQVISDAQTAVAVARPVFRQMDVDFGIPTPELLSATRDGDIWTVKSPSHCGPTDTFLKACEGNVVTLSAKDGTVLYLRHEGKPDQQ
jgi:hypothetical protein